MPPTSRQLKRLINEIGTEDIEVDQANDAVLTRWEDDNHAIDALRDILARMEKANGPVSVLDIVAFIKFVLTIKWYAEKTDRGFAKLLKLQRKKKSLRPKALSLLTRAISKNKISLEDFTKRHTDLHRIDADPQPPVRSSWKGSRIRTLFLRELSDAVHEDTGGVWMDPEVAAIASMVLDCEIDAEHVRNARRS
jgi:hypothetical protein